MEEGSNGRWREVIVGGGVIKDGWVQCRWRKLLPSTCNSSLRWTNTGGEEQSEIEGAFRWPLCLASLAPSLGSNQPLVS